MTGFLVSCEHASNRLPAGYELDRELLRLHIAWDPGAPRVARRLAEAFSAPLHLGRWSRLLVDLNRPVGNRDLIRTRAWGHPIPFNRRLSPQDKERRIERYYRPYREAIEKEIDATIARAGRAVHVAVHSFTPVLNGHVRPTDIGLLFDPERPPETRVARAMKRDLARRTGLAVHLNLPYRGTSDGLLPACRKDRAPDLYLGIELEINQKHAQSPKTLDWIAAQIEQSLRNALHALRLQ